MADRGDYRSIYCAFWDDADVHALSHLAYRVLTTLKGTLPAAGIGVVYPSLLAARCAATEAEIEEALALLETPAPPKEVGWIVRDRNVVWIVNALRFEPTLTPTNKKHRAYLTDRVLAPLGGKPIILAFRRHYPEWFPPVTAEVPHAPENGNGIAKGGVSDGYRTPIEPVSKQSPAQPKPAQASPSLTNTSPSRSQPSDAPPAAAAGVARDGELQRQPPEVLAHYALELAAAANLAIEERFGRQPTPILGTGIRAHELARELLTAGIELAFARDAIVDRIRTGTFESVPTKIAYFAGVIADAVNVDRQRRHDRDSTIGARSRMPPRIDPAAVQAATEAAEARERRYLRERERVVADWQAREENAEQLATIRADADVRFADSLASGFGKIGRDLEVVIRCAKAAGLPELEAWTE